MAGSVHDVRRRHQFIITPYNIRSLLHYDPESGVFTWLDTIPAVCFTSAVAWMSFIRNYGGTRAGASVGKLGRAKRKIRFRGKTYPEDKLVWYYYCGVPQGRIRHLNGDRCDNRWSNLADRNGHPDKKYIT